MVLFWDWLARLGNPICLRVTNKKQFLAINNSTISSAESNFSKMDPDTVLQLEFPPFLRRYKTGRIERLLGTGIVPAGLDPATGVTSKDVTIDPVTGVNARLYLPSNHNNKNKKLPVLVYYHGGGFCIESPFSPLYHPYQNSLASKANLLIVSVNYRLAPEHPIPAAYDDSWAALQWVFSPGADPGLAELGDLDRVFIAGDSAGGNITNYVAMMASEKGVEIEGAVLFHPFFWGPRPFPSEMVAKDWIEALWRMVNPHGVSMKDDPRVNVKAEGAPNLAGLICKRVMVCVAGEDWLADRDRAYHEMLKESGWGGEVELVESEGEDHCFHLQKPESEKALELMAKTVAFFRTRDY